MRKIGWFVRELLDQNSANFAASDLKLRWWCSTSGPKLLVSSSIQLFLALHVWRVRKTSISICVLPLLEAIDPWAFFSRQTLYLSSNTQKKKKSNNERKKKKKTFVRRNEAKKEEKSLLSFFSPARESKGSQVSSFSGETDSGRRKKRKIDDSFAKSSYF